jgi:hypothetical protein
MGEPSFVDWLASSENDLEARHELKVAVSPRSNCLPASQFSFSTEVVIFTLPFLEICSHNLNNLGILFLNKK